MQMNYELEKQLGTWPIITFYILIAMTLTSCYFVGDDAQTNSLPNPPEVLYFPDLNAGSNIVEGDVYLDSPFDSSGIEMYTVYWGDADGNRLDDKPIAHVLPCDSGFRCSSRGHGISTNTMLPNNAKYLLAYSNNRFGMSRTAYKLEIVDYAPAKKIDYNAIDTFSFDEISVPLLDTLPPFPFHVQEIAKHGQLPELDSVPVLVPSFEYLHDDQHLITTLSPEIDEGHVVLLAPNILMNIDVADSRVGVFGEFPYRRWVFDYSVKSQVTNYPESEYEYQIHYLETYNAIEIHVEKLINYDLMIVNELYFRGQQLSTGLSYGLFEFRDEHAVFIDGRSASANFTNSLFEGLRQDSVRFMIVPPSPPEKSPTITEINQELLNDRLLVSWEAVPNEHSITGYQVSLLDSAFNTIQIVEYQKATGLSSYSLELELSEQMDKAKFIAIDAFSAGGLAPRSSLSELQRN